MEGNRAPVLSRVLLNGLRAVVIGPFFRDYTRERVFIVIYGRQAIYALMRRILKRVQ